MITYPRTRSQFLPSDQAGSLKGIARSLAGLPEYRTAAEYVASLDVLPLGRVVNDGKIDDHHAIIPTGELPRKELSGDDARVFDLVVRRYLAVFHPEAVFEDTEVVTGPAGSGSAPGPAAGRGRLAGPPRSASEAAPRSRRGDEEDRASCCRESRGRARPLRRTPWCSRSRPSRRPLLGGVAAPDMETAGRQIEDDELREAMKDSGLGTPATRAETIEKLIRVGYVERLGSSCGPPPRAAR